MGVDGETQGRRHSLFKRGGGRKWRKWRRQKLVGLGWGSIPIVCHTQTDPQYVGNEGQQKRRKKNSSFPLDWTYFCCQLKQNAILMRFFLWLLLQNTSSLSHFFARPQTGPRKITSIFLFLWPSNLMKNGIPTNRTRGGRRGRQSQVYEEPTAPSSHCCIVKT